MQEIAKKIRKRVLQLAHDGKTAHVGSALSCVDILVSLYFDFLNLEEDRFILSKGHGAMAYYAVLEEKGILPKKFLSHYGQDFTPLSEHPPAHDIPGIDFGTGSLGHGLSVSLGAALGKKISNKSGKEIVLLGDGECNEGQIWEAAMLAASLKLDNLYAIIDFNKMQALSYVSDSFLCEKFKSFGWNIYICDGHNLKQLGDDLKRFPKNGKPHALIAATTKGYGVSFMKNNLLWHYRAPNDKELELALKGLD